MVAGKRLLAFLTLALAMVGSLSAQTPGTNMVNLITDNVTYAQTEIVPIGIGLTVLFIAIAIGVKIYRKTVK